MKIKLGIFLFALTFVINLNAQLKATIEKVTERVTIEEFGQRLDPQPLIDRFNIANGIDEKKLAAEITTQGVLRKTTAYNVGDKKNWWSSNFVTNQFYQSPATCRAVGTNCYIFVEDSMWTAGNVNQSIVDAVKNSFDNSTPSNSSKGIYQTNVETFGTPPNVDGDSKIIIFLLNIPDSYTGKEPNTGYVAGYFYSVNQSISHPNSNKSEIFYIDCKPLNLTTSSGLFQGMSTLAHEFQHMIHYNYHPGGQETFFNEGWSLTSEIVCGYGLYGQSGTHGYVNNPNRHLLSWVPVSHPDNLKEYSRAARFALYLYEQFGSNVLKNFVQSTRKGVDAFDNDVFPKLGTTRRFNDVLQDWFVANYVNDKNVSPGLSNYGYSYSPVAKVNTTNLALSSTPNFVEEGVFKGAAQYITFNAGKNITINFNRSANTAVKVKAVKIGTGLPQVSDVAMNTNVNFSDFGTAYNTLTFIVYHNDINASSNGPFTYSYTYSGTAGNITKEIKYDSTEPVGILSHTVGDTLAVQFEGFAGLRLDSIKVALRQAGSVNGGIYQYTGVTRPSPLGKKLAVPITVTSNIATRPPVPYPVPWNNWAKLDVRNKNIDATNSFVVAFTAGEYAASDATKDNRIMITEMTDMNDAYHSYTYLNKPSSGTPNWFFISSSAGIYLYLIRAYVSNGTTNIAEPIEILPSAFSLDQNYPNPFNPSTVISYTLPKQSRVQIKVYDVIGNEVRSLIDEEKSAGKYNLLWDSRNNSGVRVSSGVYFYKITADGFSETKKMVLMK